VITKPRHREAEPSSSAPTASLACLAAFALIALSALSALVAAPLGAAPPLTFSHLAGAQGGAGSEDGMGTAASFLNPGSLALDGSGNVYVADSGNRKIRKIAPGGFVTTLAGSGSSGTTDGPGTAASFSFPASVAVDASGNVYVADATGRKIRKVTAGGAVTTLAGSGSQGSAGGLFSPP